MSIIRATKNATASFIIHVMEEEIIPEFGAQWFVNSDNAGWLSVPEWTGYTKKRGTEWRTTVVNAPMHNGRAERILATIKRSVGRIRNYVVRNQDDLARKAVFHYRRSWMKDGNYLLYLIHAFKPRLDSSEEHVTRIRKEDGLAFQSFAIVGKLVDRVYSQDLWPISKILRITTYEVGDLVQVAYGNVFQSMKWTAFWSKGYYQCDIVQ